MTAEVDRLRERVAKLEAAILDIDAHATPMGEDTDGFVAQGYTISVGCLHRALGLIGHTSPRVKECFVGIDLAHGPDCEGCQQLKDIALDAVGAVAIRKYREEHSWPK